MAALRIAKDQYAEIQSKLAHHEDALCSLQWGGANIATLRRSRADLQQVQLAHELAFDRLVKTKASTKPPMQTTLLFSAELIT